MPHNRGALPHRWCMSLNAVDSLRILCGQRYDALPKAASHCSARFGTRSLVANNGGQLSGTP
jgi:hypothetical protein